MFEGFDCLIVGGGPAGLTAAIYLARFHLRVRLIDSGKSRAAMIPCTRNHAGFPDGVPGAELLDRMRRQALMAGAEISHGVVTGVAAVDGGLSAEADTGSLRARTVLLATGVTNRGLALDADVHQAALAAGRVRYCPVCDGYEVTDKAVAVIGTGAHGVREALFLRSYTARITLISSEAAHELSAAERRELAAGDIKIRDGPAAGFQLEEGAFSLSTAGGRRSFESVYPALGSDVHSALAQALGADVTEDGSIKVDAHQRTTTPRLYAAGDVVLGLDQISHAMGEAGVAATTIRNDLALEAPLRR
jgi:thioredoxin reductase (NADPH)